jgi:ribonuclease R/exosome complex exonuclease DIS3/RRP44
MIRTVDMKEDYFYFDMDRHALIGERTKKVYQLGDPIKIAVKKVNVIKRFLDFVSIK